MSDDQPRVEDELTELLESAALTRRQAGAVAARLGFDGAGAGTLQDAARDWGYSRERVRQLEARLRDRSAEARPPLPAVRKALELIEVAAPDERSWVAGQIADAGLARRPFDPAGVLAAAELIGARPTARVSGRFVTPVHLPDPVLPLLRTAEAIAAEYGKFSVELLASCTGHDAARLRRLLRHVERVHWLDDGTAIAAHTPKLERRVARTTRKVLSIARSLTLAEVGDALARGEQPVEIPSQLLRGVCESISWLAIDDEQRTVTSKIRLDVRRVLSPAEQLLAQIFTAAGPVLSFREIVELGRPHGLKPNSVGVVLLRTPILKHVERGRYALRGVVAAAT